MKGIKNLADLASKDAQERTRELEAEVARLKAQNIELTKSRSSLFSEWRDKYSDELFEEMEKMVKDRSERIEKDANEQVRKIQAGYTERESALERDFATVLQRIQNGQQVRDLLSSAEHSRAGLNAERAKVATLEKDLAAERAKVATLEADLTAERAKVATLEADLTTKVASLEDKLTGELRYHDYLEKGVFTLVGMCHCLTWQVEDLNAQVERLQGFGVD